MFPGSAQDTKQASQQSSVITSPPHQIISNKGSFGLDLGTFGANDYEDVKKASKARIPTKSMDMSKDKGPKVSIHIQEPTDESGSREKLNSTGGLNLELQNSSKTG